IAITLYYSVRYRSSRRHYSQLFPTRRSSDLSLQNVQALFQGLDEEGGFGHKRGSSMRGQGGRCPKRGAMLALRKRRSPFDHYAVAIHDNRNSMNFIDVRSRRIDM